MTRPFRPQTNGKSERFNRTMLEEWAYVREYASNAERVAAFAPWVDHYNHGRPHTALNGMTPMEFLVNNVSVNHTRSCRATRGGRSSSPRGGRSA